MINKKLDTPFVSFEIEKDILIASYKPNARITLKDAKEIVASRMAFIEGKAMPTLILNHGIVKMDKKARDFFASPEGIAGVKCAALLLSSGFISLTTNFFLKVTKTKLLVKTFTNKQEAMEWLNFFTGL
ncbi:MAG: hypothetical protein WAT19_12945 [Ferruginibacter sp.]